jgi:hypothetical protein
VGRGDSEGFVLERVIAAHICLHSVPHAHRSTSTDRYHASNANLMPLSTLTQHQHGVPDCPENVCGGTLVFGWWGGRRGARVRACQSEAGWYLSQISPVERRAQRAASATAAAAMLPELLGGGGGVAGPY